VFKRIFIIFISMELINIFYLGIIVHRFYEGLPAHITGIR
jgi:hypothetical protein